MIHILDTNKYNRQLKKTKQLKFLKGKKYDVLQKMFSNYIYRDISVNLGISSSMYFGKHIYDFINRNLVLNCPDVYDIKVNGNVIHIKICQHLQERCDKNFEYKIRNYLMIDEIAKKIRNYVYFDKKYENYFLKGYERYQTCYFYGVYMCEQNNVKEYEIRIFNLSLVLKKYKNTCFEKIDEDFGAAEVIGFLAYKRELDRQFYKSIDQVESYIMIEVFNVFPKIKEYASQNNYILTFVEENNPYISKHYIFEKENEEIIEKNHYYEMTNNEPNYKIQLIIRKKLLEKNEIKRIITEYDRIIKNIKLKEY